MRRGKDDSPEVENVVEKEVLTNRQSLILLVRLLDASCNFPILRKIEIVKRKLERQGDSELDSQRSCFLESDGGEQEGQIAKTKINIIVKMLKEAERQRDLLYHR